MNPSPPVTPEPPKRVDIKRMLVKSEIDLLKAVPCNPTVRAIVLARTGVAIPDEMTEYEQIVELVETTCKSSPRVPTNDGIQILAKLTVPVNGRCSFRATATGEDQVYIRGSEIRDTLSAMRSGDRWSHFRSCIFDRLKALAYHDLPTELTDHRYNDHEEIDRDVDDREVEIDEDEFELVLRKFMQDRFPVEFGRLLRNDGLEEE